jgi:predicted SnoaL-like aldol condensation-catalyzing enzyme
LRPGNTLRNYVPVKINHDHKTSLASIDPQLAANKRLAYDAWRTLLNALKFEESPRFLVKDYINHNVSALQGIEGVVLYHNGIPYQQKPVPEKVERFVDIVAEGDLVVLATVHMIRDDNGNIYTLTQFDMWVVKDGLLQEHWDIVNW